MSGNDEKINNVSIPLVPACHNCGCRCWIMEIPARECIFLEEVDGRVRKYTGDELEYTEEASRWRCGECDTRPLFETEFKLNTLFEAAGWD